MAASGFFAGARVGPCGGGDRGQKILDRRGVHLETRRIVPTDWIVRTMSGFAVLTPSYAPDFELCRELNRSVMQWTAPDVHHHLVVPQWDRKLFAPLRGPRTEVWTVDELLPRRMLPLSVFNAWLDPRRPYPPIRGWVMQQIVKFAAAAELGVDQLVLADSDVVLVRPVTIDTFRKDGRVRFYRSEGAVDERLPRHRLWHEVARKLLGLPPAGPAPLPDYISAFNVWDRRIVLALRERIEATPGGPGWTRSRPSCTSPSSSSTGCSWTGCSARPRRSSPRTRCSATATGALSRWPKQPSRPLSARCSRTTSR